jgi:hypothetical protein
VRDVVDAVVLKSEIENVIATLVRLTNV